jgi:hypothetical protein
VIAMPLADPIRPGWRICAICGSEGYHVLPSMAKLLVPVTGILDPVTKQPDTGRNGAYQTFARCRNASECRQRCEAAGDEWPLDDSTPRYQFVGEA